jgi:hypothetical protein
VPGSGHVRAALQSARGRVWSSRVTCVAKTLRKHVELKTHTGDHFRYFNAFAAADAGHEGGNTDDLRLSFIHDGASAHPSQGIIQHGGSGGISGFRRRQHVCRRPVYILGEPMRFICIVAADFS